MKQVPGGVTAPKGFTASGVHCGVKKGKGDGNQPPTSKMPEVLEGKKDLALIVSEQPCAAAAVIYHEPGEGRAAVCDDGPPGKRRGPGHRGQLRKRQCLRPQQP